MTVKPSEVIHGTEKEFLDIFHGLCYSRSAWQVWEYLISAIACSLSNVTDKNPDRRKRREKEYERCIKEIGSVETASRILAIIVMAYETNPDQDFLGKMYMQLKPSYMSSRLSSDLVISHTRTGTTEPELSFIVACELFIEPLNISFQPFKNPVAYIFALGQR